MPSLVRHVRDNVNPEEYYKTIFPDISWASGADETKVLSPFVGESIPSLSINKVTGAWYSFCASDQQGGTSIVSFHAAHHSFSSRRKAAQSLYHQFIHPVISERTVLSWVRQLNKTPSALSYLKKRLISLKVVRQYKLGWDGSRITIPIRNEFGLYVNAKLYSPISSQKVPKMLNYTNREETRSYGSPILLYPLGILINSKESVFICEGEWDTLALLSLGVLAVTSTGGATTWPKQYNKLFRNRKVLVTYDNDEPGKTGAKRVIRHLIKLVKSLKQINVPKKYGKDVSDYMLGKQSMCSKKAWQTLEAHTKPLVENLKELITPSEEAIRVPLDQTSQSKWYGQRIQVEALITGKDTSPYLLPEEVRISCNDDCEGCPIAESKQGFKDYDIENSGDSLLEMINVSKATIRKKILRRAGIKAQENCKAKLDYLKTFNVEYVLLIPTLGSGTTEYVVRSAYYVGHGLKANRSYRFEGYLAAFPRDQHVVYLFDSAVPAQNEIETFQLEEDTKKKLTQFRPKRRRYLAQLYALADWQSRNITKILERPDLHIMVDLAFHSVSAFWFNGEFIPRGMLDVLILGDTKCGKGYTTEGLSKYYKLGEVASGDNCSFAGLVGGLQQISNNWRVTWGLIPLNNGRLVVIDEVSSMPTQDIARMSRIRSEGIAEIVKIIRETTEAKTRLIWIANPRSGRPITNYNTGVEAVRELIGAVEDISRFDLALTVASNEVPSDIINAPATHHTEDSGQYPSELCRALILWAWSRTPKQIQFTKKATSSIIKRAIELGDTYSSVIPLIQTENVRIKIAKISAAVAARTFSTDIKYDKLIVRPEHVKCAVELIKIFYNKPSMSYDLFSKTTLATSKIQSPKDIGKAMNMYTTDELMVITGLLEMHYINAGSLSDYVGDEVTAKTLISQLVQLKCLSRLEEGNRYLKNPSFTKWLRRRKRKLIREGR